MSGSPDDSYDDVNMESGHDLWPWEVETGTTNSNDTPSEIDNANEEIEKLKLLNGHLRWHLAKYREALDKVPNGEELLQTVHDEVDYQEEEVGCTECVIETLRSTIAGLKNQLDQNEAAAGSTPKKRPCVK